MTLISMVSAEANSRLGGTGARYALAMTVVATSVAIAIFLNQFEIPTAFASLLLAVMFSVWRFGIGPGLLASGLAILCVRFFFLEPQYTLDPRLLGNEALRRLLLYSESILLLWLLGSAQRRAQERLKRSESYLADAQTLSRTGTIGFTVPDGDVFWSAETRRILGLDSKTVPTVQGMIDRIHPDDFGYARRRLYHVTAPRPSIEFEHRIVTRDGNTKHVRIFGKAVRQGGGGIRVSAAIMDITDSKRMEASLQKAQAELAHVTRLTTMGELVASITHEINQPLGAMKLNAQSGLRWIDRDVPDIGRVQSSLERIVDNVTRAESLISKLRNMAKKAEFTAETIDLNRIANDVVELLRGESHERGVACQTDLEPNISMVKGDEIQLQQIILNLVINGFDAMKDTPSHDRQLTVRSRTIGPSVALEVVDTGPGIHSDLQNKIFDAFFTTKSHGMGMGLSICRTIAEAHGGDIVAFNNERCGATFRITLPGHPLEVFPAGAP